MSCSDKNFTKDPNLEKGKLMVRGIDISFCEKREKKEEEILLLSIQG